MLGNAIRRCEQVAMALAVVCVVVLMLVTSYDAVSRYFFKSPLQWAFDVITHYLLITATYLALASTFQHGDHI